MKRDHNSVRVAVRAADVGYFNVKFTLGRKLKGHSSIIETRMFPSLAPLLGKDTLAAAGRAQKMDGCVVDVDGAIYYVGSDAAHNASSMEPRPVAEDYCMSAKYLALLRGALHFMALDAGVSVGDEFIVGNLVLGLPMNTLGKYRGALVNRVKGEHLIGLGECIADAAPAGKFQRVTVENVTVLPQPRGALFDHGASVGGAMDGWTLVVDPGGGTLDWFLSSKHKPNYQRSGAYPKAMLACAYAVADEINPTWRDNLVVVERIDQAIRERRTSFRANGRDYRLADYKPRIDAVLTAAVAQMLEKLGSTADIDLILMTGGGAKVFHDFLEANYPDMKPILRMGQDPVFANVRGFQVFGEATQSRPAQ
jgi:plasmid segregation protein ParM